ncbi:MAG: DNA-protecting protein DprA [Alphaproteobacteria bacterium]|nr:DNA-protecting protein DprA [Alphaproteobacteria bacterium]
MSRPLARAELIAWARLARTPRIGPITFHRLIARYRTASAALEALPRLVRGEPLAPASVSDAERELDRLDAMDARLVASCEPDYPPLLKQVDPPPPVIAARGRLELAHGRTIALVGAREASAAGLALARDLAAELGAMGFITVSGLARGVDAAVHRASLDSGTVAVLAGGLDNPYPPQNATLHDAIVAQGLVLSEAPLGAVARARDFPRRNHIISGLSYGVVVVEAALRSGSLITARAAAEQNREVMAAPGSPLDPRARGGNALIKGGAALVEDAADIAAHLGAAPRALRVAAAPRLSEEADAPERIDEPTLARLARLLSPTPVHVNDLARSADMSQAAVAAALVELELAGRAASLPGGFAALPRAAFER